MQALEYPFDPSAILQQKRRIRRELLQQDGLIDKKIAIVGGSTVGEVKNILELFLLDAGIRPTFWEGGYGLYYENLVFDDGSLRAFAPDFLYIHTTCRNLERLPGPADSPEQAEGKFEAEAARWQRLWEASLVFGCPVIQNNFEDPDVRLMGNLEAVDVRGAVRFGRRMNERLAQFAAAHKGFYVNDICWLAAREGLARWHSPAQWYAYKYALALECVPALCRSAASIVKSLLGKNRKAVACDLDNTLWGGVIGDEGPEGILLGEESPAGRAHSDLQRYLKGLSQMGVLLCVCSKNEESLAKEGFGRPDSPLKAEDFVAFKANWEPKPQNIAAMAKELNLLPEAFVFLDDNPAERDLVRRQLPGVAVPELAGAEGFVRALDEGGWFEPTALSEDDRRRGEMYRQNARRAQAAAEFADYGAYLESLAMTARIGPFDEGHLERITQLINKTNQFNLTTRRCTPGETAAAAADGHTITLYGALADKFGDNGITTALIAPVAGDTADIRLWVMSCRVFKRELELALFDALVAACKARGVKRITGHYIPTAKNLFVKDFYATIGFALTGEQPDGTRDYEYAIPADYTPRCTVIRTLPADEAKANS